MARIHPSFPLHAPATLGAYRERDILKMLEQGLDDRFDVFHNVPWSGMQGEQQSFGEYDFVIVSPGGQLLILEINFKIFLQTAFVHLTFAFKILRQLFKLGRLRVKKFHQLVVVALARLHLLPQVRNVRFKFLHVGVFFGQQLLRHLLKFQRLTFHHLRLLFDRCFLSRNLIFKLRYFLRQSPVLLDFGAGNL